MNGSEHLVSHGSPELYTTNASGDTPRGTSSRENRSSSSSTSLACAFTGTGNHPTLTACSRVLTDMDDMALPVCSGQENPGNSRIQYKCSACKTLIPDYDLAEAMGKYFHMECFRCRACNDLLSTSFFTHGGQPYCKHDYVHLFGKKCNGCKKRITGLVMTAGEKIVYHPECFTCLVCLTPIGESERYTLIDGAILICGSCSDLPPSDTTCMPAAKNKYVIQLLHVPADDSPGALFDWKPPVSTPNTFRASLTRKRRSTRVVITRLKKQNTSSPVVEGDIILEINGRSIKDMPNNRLAALLDELKVQGYSMTVRRRLSSARRRSGFSEKFSAMLRQGSRRGLKSAKSSDTGLRRRLGLHSSMRLSKSTTPHRPDSDEPPSLQRKSQPTLSSSTIESSPPTSPHESQHFSARVNNLRRVAIPVLAKVDTSPPPVTPNRVFVTSPTAGDHYDSEDDFSDSEAMGENTRMSDITVNIQWVRLPGGDQVPTSPDTNLPRCYSGQSIRPLSFLHRSRGLSSACHDEDLNRNFVFRPTDLEIGEVIGKGFFGQVLRVTNKTNGSVLVMKELTRFDAEAQRNFLKEVALMKSLDHNNVMHFVGIMYRNKKLHLITEYIGGGTLSERLLDKDVELPWDNRVSFGHDIACGMEYLHRSKIIHRDLTSHNCMIRLDGTVVVGDFGLAHREKNNIDSSCRLQRAVGSAYWMAPEMMKGLTYDHRADIFSFGIILCEIIGRVSADPDDLPRTMDFGLDEPAFRRDFLADCPDEFFQVALNCSNTNPLERALFGTIALFLGTLLNSIQFGLDFKRTFSDFQMRKYNTSQSPRVSRLSLRQAHSI